MAFSGVRISWLMTDKKSDLCRSACSARSRASSMAVTSTAYTWQKLVSATRLAAIW